MAAIIRLVHASSAEPGGRPGQPCGRPLMNIRSCASVITLGIGVLRLTTFLAYASPGDGQDATPGNAMNPRAVSSIVERDPEGLGIVEGSRTPSGLLIAPTPLVKEPKKAGGMLYRTTVEFVPVGVTGDKGV